MSDAIGWCALAVVIAAWVAFGDAEQSTDDECRDMVVHVAPGQAVTCRPDARLEVERGDGVVARCVCRRDEGGTQGAADGR